MEPFYFGKQPGGHEGLLGTSWGWMVIKGEKKGRVIAVPTSARMDPALLGSQHRSSTGSRLFSGPVG